MRVGQEYGILRLSRRNTFTESSITLLSVVTQHRRDDTFAVSDLNSQLITPAYPCPKKPSRVKQERERWTQRLRSLTGLRILDIS